MKCKTLMRVGLVALAVMLVTFIAHALTPSIIVRVASTSVPGILGTNDIRFRTVVFIGMHDERTNNTGTVWIQRSSTNGAPGVPLLTGQICSFTAGPAGFSDGDFYIDVETAGDGVVAILFQ